MITKREAKEIVDWVISEIQRKGYLYLTDGKLDLSKSAVGTLSGNATLGGRIADGAIWDRHVAGEADIRGTKIRIATTTERGTAQFASNLEIASAKAVQANDSRLHNTTVANATEHDARYYTETEINSWRSTLAGEAGAGMVGISNPSGWWSGSNVQQALDQLNQRAFTSLKDTPSDYEGMGGLVVAVRETEDGLEFVVPSGGGGSESFLGLTDTPESYMGQQGKSVVVNDTEDGLSFVLISGGGGGGDDFNADRVFSFVPEYPNSVLIADGSANTGTMSVKYAEGRNFYDWSVMVSGCQDYDILLRFLIPPDLEVMGSGVYIYNKSDAIGETGIKLVQFLDSEGNNVISESLVKNADWTESFWGISGGVWYSTTLATLRMRVQADQYGHARLGEIHIPYRVKQLSTQVFSFVPEYDGFVLDPYTDINNGIMESIHDDGHNAFKWSNVQPSTQDYDIVVRFRIPPNFSDMVSTLYMWNVCSNTLGNTGVRLVEFLDTEGNNVITPLTKKNASWVENSFAIGVGTWIVGKLATLRFRLYADNGEYACLGEVRVAYTTN